MKFLVAIILAVVLAEAELDIVVPSLPALQDFLGVSVFQTEWLLTGNLLAYGFSALFMGHLGDQYGKRSMLLAGTALFGLGSTFMVLFDSFPMLLLGLVSFLLSYWAVPHDAPAQDVALRHVEPVSEPRHAGGSLLGGYWKLLADRRFLGYLLSTSILPGGWWDLQFFQWAGDRHGRVHGLPSSALAGVHHGLHAAGLHRRGDPGEPHAHHDH